MAGPGEVIEGFCASGRDAELLAHFGCTVERVAREPGELLKSTG